MGAHDEIFDTDRGPMTVPQVIDHLTWCSYKAQRDLYGMSAADAMRLYPDTGEAMEARYQASINAYAGAAIKRDQHQPKWLRDSLTGAKEPK